MVFEVAGRIFPQNSSEELINWSKSIFNAIQVGILVIDAGTKTIEDVNPAAALMIGSRRENIIGNSCTLYGCLGSKEGRCPIIDLGLDVENEICVLTRKDDTKLNVIITVTSVLRNNKRYLIKSFINITNHNVDEKDWVEVENLLAENIARKEHVYRNNRVRDMSIKQDLHRALNMMMGRINER